MIFFKLLMTLINTLFKGWYKFLQIIQRDERFDGGCSGFCSPLLYCERKTWKWTTGWIRHTVWTRMSIYQFPESGKSLKTSDAKELDPSPSKIKRGISELADDPSQVEAYMMPLLESAQKTIPQRQAIVNSNVFAGYSWNEARSYRSSKRYIRWS